VARPLAASSCRKLAQPLVEQNRRLTLVRRIRRLELVRMGMAEADRSARLEIIETEILLAAPDVVGAWPVIAPRLDMNRSEVLGAVAGAGAGRLSL
jgi:hypothetical protein